MSKSYKEKEDKDVTLRRVNDITRSITYSISKEDGTNQIWKKITYIDSFDEKGLLVWQAEPRYRYTESTQSPPHRKTGGLGDYVYLLPQQTNIYAGYCDSTLFEYNKKNKIIKETRVWSEDNGQSFRRVYIAYKYDERGNQIEQCSLSDFDENHCSYTSYIYNDDGTIKLRIDSSNSNKFLSPWKGRSGEYQYDKKGNVVFDGYIRYSFDSDYNIIKKIAIKGWFDNEHLKYDDNNNLIELIAISQSDTTTFHYQYDGRGLLIEQKEIKHGKTVSLSKYEYNQTPSF